MIYISSELLFIKLFTTSKIFVILTWLNINFEIDCNHTRYVSRGTCLECLSPPEKSSGSLGNNKDKKHLVTNGMAWCPVSHTSAAQRVVGNHM